MDVSTGIISTIIGGGPPNGVPATSVGISADQVAVDSQGNLYLSNQNRVYKIDVSGKLTIVAGDGAVGFRGDGGPAIFAEFASPEAIALDGFGSIYVSDPGNFRVRKITTSGMISTVAGNGTAGFSGDGGLATNAQLSAPLFISVDSAGDLFINDFNNGRIRKVSTSGIISTVAGNGTTGFSGDGGPATSALLSSPNGIAADNAGNLFIADTGNDRIRKVTNVGIISTIAGTGVPGFSGDGGAAISAELKAPFGIAADNAGNLYIGDFGNQRVRKVTSTGVISTIAGTGTAGFSGDGGAAISAQLNGPDAEAVDSLGNLYITDSGNHRLRKLSASGIIITVAGNGTEGFSGDGGPALLAQLDGPQGLSADLKGNIYFVDFRRVRTAAQTGVVSTFAGNGIGGFSGDGSFATAAQLNVGSFFGSSGLTSDSAGNLLIVDEFNNRIRRVDASTGIITTIAGNGTAGFSGDGGPATNAALFQPMDVALDVSDNLYITDPNNHRVRRVDAVTHIITTVVGNGTAGFSGDGGLATGAQLNFPSGIALDSAGNIFFTDTQRIRRVDSVTQTITTITGNGSPGSTGDGGPAFAAQLNFPVGISFDALGNLYVADSASNHADGRIRKIAFVGATFSLSVSSNALTIAAAGGTSSDTLMIIPANGFTGAVNVSCSVAFAGQGTATALPTCSVTPAQVSIAGTAAGNATLFISTTAAHSAGMLQATATWGTGYSGGQVILLSSAVFLLLIPFAGRRRLFVPVCMVMSIGLALTTIGCGGGGRQR
ncbi:MAG TPA: NHL repeat-containing protein [Candidatus Angelobacter sp.]